MICVEETTFSCVPLLPLWNGHTTTPTDMGGKVQYVGGNLSLGDSVLGRVERERCYVEC